MLTPTKAHAGTVPTLPGRFYSDPEIYNLEIERIFSRMWVCVGLEDQIPSPAGFLAADVAGESILVVRDREGVIRAFLNVCRHRGARLCTDERGDLRATIQCRYHAWTYALDGSLIGAPNMRGDSAFDPSEHGLVRLATTLWNGLIFVSLAEHAEPLAAHAEVNHPRFDRYRIGELAIARSIDYDVRANWKLVVANYEECAHCALVHPELSARVPSFRQGLASGGLDDGADFAEGVEALSMAGKARRAPLPGLLPEDHQRYYGMTLLPNAFINLNPDHVGVTVFWPVAPDRTRVTASWLFHPAAMAEPDFDPSDVVEFSDLIKRQDWEVCELSQMGVASRGFRDGGVYGPHERHIRDFDDFVLRQIGLGFYPDC